MATRSQGFQIPADLSIQLCRYDLCKRYLGNDAITDESFQSTFEQSDLASETNGFSLTDGGRDCPELSHS